MIILETNVNGVLALPAKCDAPVASNGNGVLSTPVAFERVKSKARKIYISRPRRRVEGIQDHADLRNKLRRNAAWVTSLMRISVYRISVYELGNAIKVPRSRVND
jgi:hypothetical protein